MFCVQVALFHGDPETAAHEFEAVQGGDSQAYGEVLRTPEALTRLKASILWNSGRRAEALALLEQTVAQYPNDASLLSDLVIYRVLAKGLTATLRAARESQLSPQYVSAIVGALLRARKLDMAGELAEHIQRFRYITAYTIYALAYSGEWVDFDVVVARQKVMGALALGTAAVWFQRPDVLQNVLAHLPESWRLAFESVFWGRPVPADAAWAVDRLMVHWADVGCWELLRAAAASLSQGGGLGRAAWLLWRAGAVRPAVEWATEDPEHPDSLEVLGLFAYQQGDHTLAGQLLTDRIRRGSARVEVYATAAKALESIGEQRMADRVRQLGLQEHPWSKLLR